MFEKIFTAQILNYYNKTASNIFLFNTLIDYQSDMRFFLFFAIALFLNTSLNTLSACSGTGEVSFCNILHRPGFVASGLVWIGEPTGNCVDHDSSFNQFRACQFSVVDVLHGNINTTDSIYTNSDSLIWLIGGPGNLCYENANYDDGTYLFASNFRSHYSYDGPSFKGYGTFSFNADVFTVSDTLTGALIENYSYFPDTKVEPDTVTLNQLQYLVDNCISNINAQKDFISVFDNHDDSNTFTLVGELENYTVQIIDVNGQVVTDYETQTNAIHIDKNVLPDGLYFVSVQHKTEPDVYVQKIVKQ